MTDQFEPLAFATGERVDGLAELEITEPDFLQELQTPDSPSRRSGLGKVRKKSDDLFDSGIEDIGDGERA
jgi:hypothetical protein